MKESGGTRIVRRVLAIIPCGVIRRDCEPVCPTVGRCLLIALVAGCVVSGMRIVCSTDSSKRFGAIDLRKVYAAGEFPLWSIARAICLIPSSDENMGISPKETCTLIRVHIKCARAAELESVLWRCAQQARVWIVR